jgi:hydrogenase/urease accessory protein HupE
MVHLIFGQVDRASLVHLPTAIAIVNYIVGFGMMQSSPENVSWAGTCLVFGSAKLCHPVGHRKERNFTATRFTHVGQGKFFNKLCRTLLTSP